MRIRLASVMAIGALALSATSFGALLTNGDFEQFTVGASGQTGSGFGYYVLGVGATGLNSWNVGTRAGDVSVDVVTTPYARYGNYSVDLAGSPAPGSISHLIASLTAGQWYSIEFDALATNTGNQAMVIELGGASTTFNVGIGSITGPLVHYSVLMQAGATNSNILFGTTLGNHSNGNLFIDNVSLQAVPEPFTMSLLAGAALAGYGRMRRRKLTV